MFNDLFKSGSDCHHCFAGAGATVEGDNRNGRVKQQLEGKALLFVARAQAPGFGGVAVEHAQLAIAHPSQG